MDNRFSVELDYGLFDGSHDTNKTQKLSLDLRIEFGLSGCQGNRLLMFSYVSVTFGGKFFLLTWGHFKTEVKNQKFDLWTHLQIPL